MDFGRLVQMCTYASDKMDINVSLFLIQMHHDLHRLLCVSSSLQIYELALKAIDCSADQVIFFDDSHRNVASASTELGIQTVLVSAHG